MSWLVDVEFKPSTVEGIGIFARKLIRANTKIWQFDPSMHVCDFQTLRDLDPALLKFALHGGYLHTPSGKFLWYTDGMQFMNHGGGAVANSGLGRQKDNSVALRDISPGEELFEDYTFWCKNGLQPDHWLYQLYLDFCPGHYSFLTSLESQMEAA